MGASRTYLAFDIGASNGRCLAGRFDGERLSVDVVSRFDNGYVRIREHLYWDIVGLWNSVKRSLRQASAEIGPDIASIGIDTWGTDFGLLDVQGNPIANPICYRDPHTTGMMAEAQRLVPREEIFRTTGVQFMEINTLYHLMALARSNSPALEAADTLLFIPDLLGYWLTGRKCCEYTNASTSQAMDASTRQWAYPLLRRLGVPERIFPGTIEPGSVLAPLSRDICQETGLGAVPVVAVGSHDTASAVAGVPATTESFAYLSSGTWGLLGSEVPRPILTDRVLEYNFGNEGGVYNTVRLLRNIVNMWLVQECQRVWSDEGSGHTWDELARMSSEATPFIACIDPDSPEFVLPASMPAAVQEYTRRTGQRVPNTHGEIMRVVLEGLAMKYHYTFDRLSDLLGHRPEVFHIVGGASRNRLLNQFAANALGQPVLAGPAEATCLGNLLVQMIACGDLANMAEGRQLLARSFPVETFLPEDTHMWQEQYGHFRETLGLPAVPGKTHIS